MTSIRSVATALAMANAFASPSSLAAACVADSGTTRATLVELYTSEGCSSCPPADRELQRLTMAGPRVIPLALHVDYWDSLGWQDRFAQPAFAERQRWEVRANGERTSFTPHFFVNGREVDDWRSDLGAQLQPAARPPTAHLAIVAEPDGADLHVRVDGDVDPDTASRGRFQLFVVLTSSHLSSDVSAGENRGARLEHDAVARTWIGPIAVHSGHVAYDRVVDVPRPADAPLGVVAFIQNAGTAEVLQAADTGVCKPG